MQPSPPNLCAAAGVRSPGDSTRAEQVGGEFAGVGIGGRQTGTGSQGPDAAGPTSSPRRRSGSGFDDQGKIRSGDRVVADRRR